MSRPDEYAGDTRWGWQCPRCDADVPVTRNPETETYRWECPKESCDSVGFGFTSRRRARIALREYYEAYRDVYR